MSKKTQDMSKVRKKLEQSSRKTRRSTDLRRSLGRKSVGDDSDLGSLEQASFSNCTLDESCHLNTDSAIINPSVLENPDWYKKLPPGIQASEESIHAAWQKQRDAQLLNESNLSLLNISLDKRKIHNILDCSVLVSRDSIDRHINSKSVNVGSNTSNQGSPQNEELSDELPKRKPNTLRRGLRKRSGTDFQNELRKALEDSSQSDENAEPAKKIVKSTSKHMYENSKTSAQSSSSHQISDNEESLEELPMRKTNTLRRGLRKKSRTSFQNELKKVLEDSSQSDVSEEPAKALSKSSLKEMPEIKNTITHSQSLNQPSLHSNDSSVDVPKRQQNTLRKGFKKKSRKSFEIALMKALEDSHSDASVEVANEKFSNVPDVLEGTAPSESQPLNPLPPGHNDSSMDIPIRRPNTLGKGFKDKSRKSFENALMQALEDSGHSEASVKVATEKILNQSKDMPEDIATSKSQPLNPLPPGHNDSSMDIPKRRPNTLGKGFKDKSRKSFENALMQALEDSGHSEASGEVPVEKSVISANISSTQFNLTTNSQVSKSLQKENMPNNKLTIPLDNYEEDTVNTSQTIPLGAEACNMIGSSSEIKQVKRSLSLGKKRVSKESGFIAIAECSESSTEKTDTTRHAPISIANEEPNPHLKIPLDLSSRSKNASQLSVKLGTLSTQLDGSQIQNLEKNSQSVLSEIMPVNLTVSFVSGSTSPKKGSLLQQSLQTLSHTPISTQESLPPRRISKSFQEKPQDENLRTKTLESVHYLETGHDEESSASTWSNPLDEIESNAMVINVSQKVEGNASQIIESTGSDSVFQKLSSNVESSFQVIESIGSDSVFESPPGNVSKAKSLDGQKHAVSQNSSNVPEILQDPNNGRTKDSFPDLAHTSARGIKPLGEVSSPSAVDSDENEDGYANEGESSDQSDVPQLSLKHTPLSDSHTNKTHKGVRLDPLNEKKPLTVSKNAPVKGLPKKMTESELENMRLGLKKWMDEIRRDVHTTVEESQPISAPNTTSITKTTKAAPKVTAKKKDPDPYFGDYRPPKRVKPRPYVTDKMYKYLEKTLKNKFGLEARIKAEEFVTLMCHLVQTTIKEKNPKKYHPLVFKLRNEMVKLGLIKTQFDYHLFIEDYLPHAFRVKSIPCYGCSKAPDLDVEDLHADLSIR